MCSLIFNPENKTLNILEPNPGAGNLVNEIKKSNHNVIAPEEFNNWYDNNKDNKFDYVISNPNFTPMQEGYNTLFKCMELTNKIITIQPWLCIINGEKRTQKILDYGLKRVIHLPRTVFKGSRIQACILVMEKNYNGIPQLDFYKK